MPEEELAAIGEAATAFRERWARVQNPPWPAAFDFTLKDVETIHYMEYEGITFPDCGTDGAVLIVAEVVRRAARMQWYMSYRGEWILTDASNAGRCAVAPRARFHESECGRSAQFGNYLDLMAELALVCVGCKNGEGLLALFPEGSEYLDKLQLRLDRIRRGDGSELPAAALDLGRGPSARFE